jgi:signal transduction histidine kinase
MTATPRDRRYARLLSLYVGVVSAGGFAVLAVLAPASPRAFQHAPLAVWLLVAGTVSGEFLGVDVHWRGKAYYYTMASPFALALLSTSGLPAAVAAAAAGSVLDDLVHRSAPRKTLFNVAQSSLALAAAGVVYGTLSDGPLTSLRQAPAFCAAAFLKLLLSELLVRTAVALDQQAPRVGRLLQHSTMHAVTAFLNLGMTLIALLGVPNRLLLPVVLAVPILAMHQACRVAARAHADRERAEAAQIKAELARVTAEKAQLEEAAARVEAERQADRHARMLGIARGLVHRLRAQDHHKDEAIALVAHDLRDPLSGIQRTAGTLLNQDHQQAPRQGRDYLAMILQYAGQADERARALLLDVHHHRTHPIPDPGVTVTDAAAATHQAGLVATFMHPDRRIDLEVAPHLPVRAHPQAVDRVLSILLDNAVGYAAPGTPIRLEAARRDDQVVLAVQDHGPGIPEADRERIFEQFTRLQPARRRGLGLGLYIARSLARAQGGELVAVDPVGAEAGARFELRLPAARRPAGGVPGL